MMYTKDTAQIKVVGFDNDGEKKVNVVVKRINTTPDEAKLAAFGKAYKAVSDLPIVISLQHIETKTTEIEIED